MLVICEDCAKKYNIDESRIRGNRARFTCNECGHIIIVEKADLSRSLISKTNSGGSSLTSSSSASSIDLLREMEAPIINKSVRENMNTDASSEVEKKPAGKENRRKPFWKNRGIPLYVYFMITLLFSLVCVSIVTGYLYTEFLFAEYLADVTRQSTDYRSKLMIQSSFAFGGVWMFVLVVFSLIGGIIHRKFKKLVDNANQLAQGVHDITIVKNGPKEVRDLAFALERIRRKLQANV